jgi:Tfp pilus assembly protein PilZ
MIFLGFKQIYIPKHNLYKNGTHIILLFQIILKPSKIMNLTHIEYCTHTIVP